MKIIIQKNLMMRKLRLNGIDKQMKILIKMFLNKLKQVSSCNDDELRKKTH